MPDYGQGIKEHDRPSTSYLGRLRRWLQIKKYQYEVTFSLYMLTPAEKLVFSQSLPSPSKPHRHTPLVHLPLHNTNYSRLWLTIFLGWTDVIILVLLSLLITAAVAYLPNHLAVISNRLWYYMHGEYLFPTKAMGAAQSTGADGGLLGDVVKKVVTSATAARPGEEALRRFDEL
jgi:Small subunit of serine palmitoyltransferase-like